MFICCCVILGLDSSGGQQNQTNFEQYGESINFLRGTMPYTTTGTNDSAKTSRTELCFFRYPITPKDYFSVSIYLSVDVKECLNNGSHLSKIVKSVIRLQISEINV